MYHQEVSSIFLLFSSLMCYFGYGQEDVKYMLKDIPTLQDIISQMGLYPFLMIRFNVLQYKLLLDNEAPGKASVSRA